MERVGELTAYSGLIKKAIRSTPTLPFRENHDDNTRASYRVELEQATEWTYEQLCHYVFLISGGTVGTGWLHWKGSDASGRECEFVLLSDLVPAC